MSDANPPNTTPDNNIDIDTMEAALAAAKERKEKIRRTREEAACLAREEAEQKAEEECLTKEEAERKAEEVHLAKEEAKRKEAERVEAEWKACEDEAEAKARAEEEERARHRQLAEKIANNAITEMRAVEEKLIVEQKVNNKVVDADKVAKEAGRVLGEVRKNFLKSLKMVDESDSAVKIVEGPVTKPQSGTTKKRKRKRGLSSEVNVGEASLTKCGECVCRKCESCIRWLTKGTMCEGCHNAKVRCSHADQLKGVLRKRTKKEGGEGSVTGSSTEFEDAVLNWLVRILLKGKGKAKEETEDEEGEEEDEDEDME
ncbi:hypothetical protein BT96DRAFT_950975 [Gymnopus androsaceus JB14]|uniref:Uncharacterized protein n=1 Tax=Gymnopus androsaceus JB14 TaxID=1447944 RepID=A0A6A4GEK2_9AGAR|nr:hypothetical protein BT96DRAFT_950975 [Gymnopus androsaceus JB14]